MKHFVAVLLLSVTGCNKTENTFVVADPGGTVAGAQVKLCDVLFPLRRSDGSFSGRVPITCEGDGEVILHLSDGRETQCRVGYITPGATQHFEFAVDDARCDAVDVKR